MTSSSEQATPPDPVERPIAAKKAAAKKAAAKKRAAAQAKTAGPKAKAAAKPKPPAEPAPPVAGPVRMKRRHFGIVFSFILFVIGPIWGAGYYLYEHALDQYVSEVGFTVRREEAPVVSSLISSAPTSSLICAAFMPKAMTLTLLLR